MEILAKILVGFVALEHLYILYLEMFAWETKGKEAFKGSLAPELFKPTKTLAANQGLYNGFLAAGLIWTFLLTITIGLFILPFFSDMYHCSRRLRCCYHCQQKDIFYTGFTGNYCFGFFAYQVTSL